MEKPTPHSWTIIADSGTCDALASFLKAAALKLEIVFEPDQGAQGTLLAKSIHTDIRLDLPIRIGALLDILASEKEKTHSIGKLAQIKHPRFSLNPQYGIIRLNTHGEEKEINLTEKETAILLYLLNNLNRTVTRKELLNAVWEYAETVETHTLETHIYRLRQKIEKNPSEPQILLTSENGYILK